MCTSYEEIVFKESNSSLDLVLSLLISLRYESMSHLVAKIATIPSSCKEGVIIHVVNAAVYFSFHINLYRMLSPTDFEYCRSKVEASKPEQSEGKLCAAEKM